MCSVSVYARTKFEDGFVDKNVRNEVEASKIQSDFC